MIVSLDGAWSRNMASLFECMWCSSPVARFHNAAHRRNNGHLVIRILVRAGKSEHNA